MHIISTVMYELMHKISTIFHLSFLSLQSIIVFLIIFIAFCSLSFSVTYFKHLISQPDGHKPNKVS